MGRTFSGADFKPDPGVTKEMMDAVIPAVGQIALSWGFIESSLRGVYWTLERVRSVPYPTSKATFEVVVDIVRQAGEKLPELSGDVGGLLRAAASEAKSLAAVRNTVCHWVIVEGREKPKLALRFAQWRGDGWSNTWKDCWYGVEELNAYATKSNQLADFLIDYCGQAIEALEPPPKPFD